MSIQVERRDCLQLIGIDRHHRKNAIDKKTAEELHEAFTAFEADEELSVAVLYGLGNTFCSGADLKEIQAGKPNRLEPEGSAPLGPTRLQLSKPVVAAIEGHAVAGGLELALWCDLRVMAEDAILGVYCRRWGIPLIDGGTVRLPRLIGLSRALDLILTGRPVHASEALQIGLVNRVVLPQTTLEAAVSLAEQISDFPSDCLRADRYNAYKAFDQELPQALRAEFEHARSVLDENIAPRLQQFTRKH